MKSEFTFFNKLNAKMFALVAEYFIGCVCIAWIQVVGGSWVRIILIVSQGARVLFRRRYCLNLSFWS